MSSCKGSTSVPLRCSTFLALTLVLLGNFVLFAFGEPVTFTNAASELQPRQVEPSSFWIGSHTLDFTPNPFLKGRDRESRLTSVESSVVANILASPSSSTTEIPQRRGRKVKRRRRLRNRNSKATNPNRRGRKLQSKSKGLEETKISGTVETVRPRQFRRRPNALIQSDIQFKTQKPITRNLARITTPQPIIPDLDPRSSQMSMSFANIHPENMNPTYFRNIILKAMMDRLVGVEATAANRSVNVSPSQKKI